MKKFRRILLVLYVIICSSIQSHAQTLLQSRDLSAVKIDDYTEGDIKNLQVKMNEMGMTETQLFKLAEERGLPVAEIAKLRKRMVTTVAIKNNDIVIPSSAETNNNSMPMQAFSNDASIFGSELFTKNSLAFEPNLRISTPSGYILGPDDEIVLIVYGTSEKTYNLAVNAEGYIYIPNVGPLYVTGLSIEQAAEKIKSKLASTIYRAIRSGQTKVQVSLGKIRSIRVTVIGEAQKPGTLTISSLTTLYNVLYLCGGPTPMGSYRAIEIVRGNEVKRVADLYAFLLKGNQKDNILLQEGDVIRIPYYKNRVTITGEVKRKGKFELLDGETFKNLLEYCGGFNDNAYRASVSINRITDKERKIIDLDAAEYGNFNVNGSDEFFVGRLLDRFENRVFITGAVIRSGAYELNAGMTLKALLEKAGGITSDAFTNRVSIFRYLQNKQPTVLSVNLDSVLKYKNNDVLLNRDDSVNIHSIFEYTGQAFVSIEGSVRIPGNIVWRQNLSLRDVLLSNGSLTESGDIARIEISRRIKDADVRKPDYLQTNVFTVNLSNKNDASGDVLLQPFDMIVVKGIPGYTVQRVVLVQGEVLNPGRYSLQKSGDKISDLFKRVGSFKSTADSANLTIRRSVQSGLSIDERERIFKRILNVDQDSLAANEKLRNDIYKNYDIISINLNKALSDPSSTENLLLEEGDILSVDRNSSLVKISGEVYYPTMVPYKTNTNLKYYIKQAGNYTLSARKKGAIVVYPDGRVKGVKHFLFFNSYPMVTPRSEIFVPQKLTGNKTKMSTGEWAIIISSLGIVASLLKTVFP